MEGKAEAPLELSDEKCNLTSDFNDLCSHMNTKISNIKKSLQLRKIDQEPSLKTVLSKIIHEVSLLNKILNKLEIVVNHQENQQSQLKELQETIERYYKEAQHLEENMPIHLPRALPIPSSTQGITAKVEAQCKDPEVAGGKKPGKESRCIKQASLLTEEEFESIPAYMRGRLTYNQVNAVLQEINKAVVSKYKIMNQPPKTMSGAVRNLFFRFKEEETKNTKGHFFIVEADVEEFTQLKADKRFHSILTILRHCQRLREIRGSRLVRYAIC
nr:spindle and kinetochore-associated protein 1 isoform X2 [Zootoca vivipara]